MKIEVESFFNSWEIQVRYTTNLIRVHVLTFIRVSTSRKWTGSILCTQTTHIIYRVFNQVNLFKCVVALLRTKKIIQLFDFFASIGNFLSLSQARVERNWHWWWWTWWDILMLNENYLYFIYGKYVKIPAVNEVIKKLMDKLKISNLRIYN